MTADQEYEPIREYHATSSAPTVAFVEPRELTFVDEATFEAAF